MPPMASTAILALLTIPSLASALTIHKTTWARPRISPDQLFSRDSTCGDASYAQCATDLPSNFCCPTTSTCMPLAGNTTALCCPKGGDCSQIEPIPCDVSLENKSKYPSATVMTSALSGTLETCGTDKCCPFGYSCDKNVCNLDSDQSAKPSTSSSSGASSSTASSTKSSTSIQTAGVSTTTATDSSAGPTSSSSTTSSSGSSASAASAAADTSSSASSAATSDGHDSEAGPSSSSAGLVAGGVIGGIAGFVCLGLLVLFLIKRERKRRALSQSRGDGADPRASSSFGNILHQPVTKGSPSHPEISGPIMNETGTWRSDFTRKASLGSPGSFHNSNNDADEGTVDTDGHHDGLSYNDELEDEVASMRDTPRSPPRVIDPNGNTRVVSSMYGSFYDPNDPVRQSEYQGPIKMPSARHFGGDEARASIAGHWLGDAVGEENEGDEVRVGSEEMNAAYIDVFADSNALAPAPLGEKRETRFSDFGR